MKDLKTFLDFFVLLWQLQKGDCFCPICLLPFNLYMFIIPVVNNGKRFREFSYFDNDVFLSYLTITFVTFSFSNTILQYRKFMKGF